MNLKLTVDGVWIILIILAVFAFLLGYLKPADKTLVTVLLISTVLKGELIINYFMGLREVQFRYSLIPMLWLGTVSLLIAVAYYLPAGAK